MKNRITTDELNYQLRHAQLKSRSAWEKGVYEYAIDFVADLNEYFDYTISDFFGLDDMDEKIEELKITASNLYRVLLNGAEDFKEFSWCGSALIYDGDIAKRLCTPSELKKTDNGTKRPNKNEEWLDVQARALYQAYLKIRQIITGKELVY